MPSLGSLRGRDAGEGITGRYPSGAVGAAGEGEGGETKPPSGVRRLSHCEAHTRQLAKALGQSNLHQAKAKENFGTRMGPVPSSQFKFQTCNKNPSSAHLPAVACSPLLSATLISADNWVCQTDKLAAQSNLARSSLVHGASLPSELEDPPCSCYFCAVAALPPKSKPCP